MTVFIQNYVDGCTICQSTKTITNPTKLPYIPIRAEPSHGPWETVTIDFITELPITEEGHNCIMIAMDHDVTKGAVFTPCHTTITAEQTAKLYLDYVWKRYGLAKDVISD